MLTGPEYAEALGLVYSFEQDKLYPVDRPASTHPARNFDMPHQHPIFGDYLWLGHRTGEAWLQALAQVYVDLKPIQQAVIADWLNGHI